MVDLGLDALSLASIYFLAAIGLAITFGVMGVINMAHGEFIMMGAYTGYVVQQYIPNHTASIAVAIPLAFAVTFAAGVAMERLVIRWLYNRPLETLLATFGISIALQQLAKNIFGTQARPLTAPAWLDGAWVVNDVIAISYIRIAIFVARADLPRRFPLHHEAHPARARNPRGDPEPQDGRRHGHQPRTGQHAHLRPRLRHRRRRRRRHRPLRQGHLGARRRLHRPELHDRRGRRCRQHLGHAARGRHDRLPAKGDRVGLPVQHAGGADLHDRLHHHFHPVPAARASSRSRAGRRGIDHGSHFNPFGVDRQRGGAPAGSDSRPGGQAHAR